MAFHRSRKDKNFGQRASGHPPNRSQNQASVLLCYVGHHDVLTIGPRRKLETHQNWRGADGGNSRTISGSRVIPTFVDAPPRVKERKDFRGFSDSFTQLRRS
jgi:hypothetical protein